MSFGNTTTTINIPNNEIQDILDGCQAVRVTEFNWNQDRQQPDVGFDVMKDMEYELDLDDVAEYTDALNDLESAQDELKAQDAQIEDLFNHMLAVYADNADQDTLIEQLQQEIAELKNKKSFWKF